MTLSDTQTLILTAAAQHPDGIAAPPASLPPAPRATVAKALLRAGLLAPAGAEYQDAVATWKLDGAAGVLRITEAGLRAIGVGPKGLSAQAGEATQELPATQAAAAADAAVTTMPAHRCSESLTAAGAECVVGADQSADAAQGASQAPDRALLRPSLHDAARAVLVAWDAPDRPDLASALEALRTALPTRLAVPRSTAPRPPRQDTKQATVLALLRRPEGATVAQIAEATGWAHHTVCQYRLNPPQKRRLKVPRFIAF